MKLYSILFILLFAFLPDGNSLVDPYDQPGGVRIGDRAPDIELSTPEGKTIKLSSLQGKVVLIDFWASWCGPCRRENPNLVRVYKKYEKAKFKDAKGFEIFSVSLDNNHKAWAQAIKSDNLYWPSHVSDLRKWKSEPAKVYGVRSIPSSFLVDQRGMVIAKNLRGTQIDLELDKLVKKF